MGRETGSMSLAGLLCLWLGCLLLHGGAAKPLGPPCPCPDYLQSDCDMQGFADGPVPAGKSFYIDFARRLCTCGPSGNITCASRCPAVPAACAAVGSPMADGCPQCICYDEDELPVPAGAVTARGAQVCTCPPQGGQLQCSGSKSEE
ncbi:fibulin-2-like isoform X2 [Dromaius novaehollandiae]|uniref:fibulin-2-like isoform X2 n=1 Tax=Dromaius novaehollandiae TaxID=8790 RepID=UPI000E1E9595|nr:fibulin-2-like [Dromaius novaehollandiae]